MKITGMFAELKVIFDRHFKLITPYHHKLIYKAKKRVSLVSQTNDNDVVELDKGQYYILDIDCMLFCSYDDDFVVITSIETLDKNLKRAVRKLEIEQIEQNKKKLMF